MSLTSPIATRILLVFLCIGGSSAAESDSQGPIGGFRLQVICAIVNGKEILEEDVRAERFRILANSGQVFNLKAGQLQNDRDKHALKRLIDRAVILSEIETKFTQRPALEGKLRESAAKESDRELLKIREKLNTNQALDTILASQGLSVADLSRQIENNFIASEYIRCRMLADPNAISHRAIKQYYEDHPEEFGTMLNAQKLDEKTQRVIFIKLRKKEYHRIVRELRQNSAIKEILKED